MYKSFDVAKEFLNLAEKEGVTVDAMKLLKLTYIAHGYHLGFFKTPLIEEQIQAWQYGPVIPQLYHVIKRFGSRKVDKETIALYSEHSLDEDAKDLIDKIWNKYSELSGLELSTLTHVPDSPWGKSYKPGIQNIEITNKVIQKYYSDLIEQTLNNNADHVEAEG